MSGKYDVVSKDLVEVNPADVLEVIGQKRPPERVRVIDADLSTVSSAADKVVWVDDPEPWILHFEFHTYWDDRLPFDLNVRSALLQKRHGISVASVVFLLRPEANAKALTGVLRNKTPVCTPSEFHYEIVRMWNLPPETILNGPLSLLPYAPLCGVNEAELPAVVARMRERIAAEAGPSLAGKLWTATFVLMGLQFSEQTIQRLISAVQTMRESVTYQAILREGREEGREEEARNIILRQGSIRFGLPDEAVANQLRAINEIARLEEMSELLLKVNSWQELLASK